MLIIVIPRKETLQGIFHFFISCIISSNALLYFPKLLAFGFHYFDNCEGKVK